jgi:hypothetical protein
LTAAFVAAACLILFPVAGGSVRSSEPTFRFQSNFWVNLHHLVRAEARRRSMGVALLLPIEGLAEAERADWKAALDAYVDLAKESLIFDERLIRMNSALAGQTGASTLPAGLLEPDLASALNRAAPIYRARLWSDQNRVNEAWIRKMGPIIDEHAPSMMKKLADAYHVTWPAGPILVDTSRETGPTLAYTTGGPEGTAAHTTISPEKSSEMEVAFEIIFHEASHAVDDQIMRILDEEGKRQGVKPLEDLWHGVIFYTSGELAKREMGWDKDPDYQAYAYREGVWDRKWEPIRAALEKSWQPYLDGKIPFERAVSGLVAEASKPEAEPKNKEAPPISP